MRDCSSRGAHRSMEHGGTAEQVAEAARQQILEQFGTQFRPFPRSFRYNFTAEEELVYRRFVDMLAQLDKQSRLGLAEEAVKEAAERKR